MYRKRRVVRIYHSDYLTETFELDLLIGGLLWKVIFEDLRMCLEGRTQQQSYSLIVELHADIQCVNESLL
jgi:hypothetical protein